MWLKKKLNANTNQNITNIKKQRKLLFSEFLFSSVSVLLGVAASRFSVLRFCCVAHFSSSCESFMLPHQGGNTQKVQQSKQQHPVELP